MLQMVPIAMFLSLWILGKVQGITCDGLNPLHSSRFEMKFVPANISPQSSTASNLLQSIRSSLIQSIDDRIPFSDIFHLYIVPEKLISEKLHDATELHFYVILTPCKIANDSNTTIRTTHALDNLVSETFSQPTVKSGFLTQLRSSNDTMLMNIKSVSIGLLESEVPLGIEETSQTRFSIVDLVLVTCSTVILSAVLCLACVQHRNLGRGGKEGIFHDLDQDVENAPRSDVCEPASIRLSTDPSFSMTSSMDDSVGQESDAHSPIEDGVAATRHGSSMASPVLQELSRSLSKNDRMCVDEPLSSDSSFQSSSAGLTCSQQTYDEGSAYLAGGSSYDFSVHTSESCLPDPNRLGASLRRLPDMEGLGRARPADCRHSSCNQSYSSTPMESLLIPSMSGASSVGSSKTEPSDFRCRSLRSGRMLFGYIEDPDLEGGNTTVTDSAVTVEQGTIVTVASEDFERNWNIAERRAAEDYEEDSTLDVFHIDVDSDRSGMTPDLSTLSQWMKSIQVIVHADDSSGSTTSTASQYSSTRRSSVGSNSIAQQHETSDDGSVDVSLENSLEPCVLDIL